MSRGYTRHPVLFEDDAVIVIAKPSGILSHPNHAGPTSAAFEGPYHMNDRTFQTPAGPLWLIHRLDQEASGALLAAKNSGAARACREAFETQKVEKDYLVLVSRKPLPPKGKWMDFLSEKKSGNSVKTRIGTQARPNAVLYYAQKEFFPRFNVALLEVRLVTGKTHQIRAQSAYRGHPVAGDRVYGNFTLNKELRQALDLRRLFLHAWRLVLPNPVSGKPLTVECPLPEDLEHCLLRASSPKR